MLAVPSQYVLLRGRDDRVPKMLPLVGDPLKPSAMLILNFLRRNGASTTTDIIRNCPTTTPTKRLSELWKAGLIDKDIHESGTQMVYWAKEAS